MPRAQEVPQLVDCRSGGLGRLVDGLQLFSARDRRVDSLRLPLEPIKRESEQLVEVHLPIGEHLLLLQHEHADGLQ